MEAAALERLANPTHSSTQRGINIVAIYLRNASGLQLDEVMYYDQESARSVEELQAEMKNWNTMPENVQAAWLVEFEKQIAAQEDDDALNEDFKLLQSLKSYISVLEGFVTRAKAARKTVTLSLLKGLKPADYTREKLDPIQEASGFISYHQLLGQIAEHVDKKDRPKKAEDQKARDWTAIDGIDPKLVATIADFAKLK